MKGVTESYGVWEPEVWAGWPAAIGVLIWGAVCTLLAYATAAIRPVFAADTNADTWVKIAVAFLAGGGLLKILQQFRSQRKDAIDEYEKVLAQLRADRDSDRKLRESDMKVIEELRAEVKSEMHMRMLAEAKLVQEERNNLKKARGGQ